MKKIKLTQNKYALVDDEDFEILNKYKWYANKQRNIYYALTRENKKIIKMHQKILGDYPVDKPTIDHKDGDGLNNQRNNIRFATVQENGMNRKIGKNNKSGHKGVSWNKRQNRWQASTKFNQKTINLGEFKNKEDAIVAYENFVKNKHKDFFRKN